MSRTDPVKPVRVLALASGKGGVGKTSVAINLAAALARAGQQVLLFDANLGIGHAQALLGLAPEATLADVFAGRRSLQEVMLTAPGGFQLLPGASGESGLIDPGSRECGGLVQAFSELTQPFDTLLIDLPTGASHSMITFARAAQDVMVVMSDDPASQSQGQALIAMLARDYGFERFRILANMAHSIRDGYELFGQLVQATASLPNLSLDYAGSIPHDDLLRQAVRNHRLVIDSHPASRVAQAFRKLAARVDSWPIPVTPSGQVEFFIERLVQARRGTAA